MVSYCCPVCQQALHPNDRQWRCPQGHSFDQAKEGYLNLLLTNQKKTRDPGDNAEMMNHRRLFLELGLYRFMPERIIVLILEHASETQSKEALDLGSGEGYYTNLLQSGLPNLRWHGVDISKPGVRMAAKKYRDTSYAVASSYELPLQKRSQSIVTQVFAPSSLDEVCRVLETGGLYVAVNSGPEHLWGLKQRLYDTPRQHETATISDDRLTLVSEEVLTNEVVLSDSEQMHNLFVMTPFYWNVGQERQKELEELQRLETSLSFHIAVYRREKDAPTRYWEVKENSSSTG